MLVEVQKTIPNSFKQMLSVKEVNGQTVVRINYSSLDIIQTCMRKAKYALHDGWRVKNSHPALNFGSAIHAAMEVWYSADRTHRSVMYTECEDSNQLMLINQPPVPHKNCARCASVFAFIESGKEALKNVPETNARSLQNGVNILHNYFDTYLDDPYDLLTDSSGPMCERDVELVVYESKTLKIILFGRIDSIFKNRILSEILVTDHKTTMSIGKDFLNRIKPNFQYTGYFLMAREALGLDVKRFMVNGIQVAKTKMEVRRQFVTVTDEDISELKKAIMWNIANYLNARDHNNWVMSTPNACSMWGGCSFKKVCEVPNSLKENILKYEYTREVS